VADLLTHYVSARIPGGFIADERARTTLALGVFLPDLVGKGLEAIPWMPNHAHAPSHSILGLMCTSLAAAMLFAEDFRFKAFATILFGQLLHVAVDVAKDCQGQGAAYLLLPFALDSFEMGYYTSQHVFWFLPGNILILILLRWTAKRMQKSGLVWR